MSRRFCQFWPKNGCHGNDSWAIGTKGQIGNLPSYTYHMHGRPGKWVKYYSRVVFNFFCDQNFCSRPETKPKNWFLRGLIHGMSYPCYWIARGIKLQKVSDFLIFYPKTPPKWAWIGMFKLIAQNNKTCILSKLLHWFKPNFAQWQRPPTAISLQQFHWSQQNLAHFGPPKGMGR